MDDIRITNFNSAQLYWDDQDAKNTGWVLRWLDARGQTETSEIGETEDAGLETLAHQAADCAPERATGDITVFRGDRPAGRISLRDGSISGWRAL